MKKNIWKRLLSLALALMMVVGLLPMGASAEGLSGTEFTTNPGSGFTFFAELKCRTCDKTFPYGGGDNTHQFTINSFSYTIANGTYSFTISYSVKVCGFEETKNNQTRDRDYNCSNSVEAYYYFRDPSSQYYRVSVDVTRPITPHTGTATCKTAANCTLCGTSYTNANTHENPNEFTYSVSTSDSTKHDKKYACCGATMETVAHTGEPTYTVNAADHTKHDKTYSCCEGIAETTGHNVTYSATSGNEITEICSDNCGHSKTATLQLKSGAALTYTGSAIEPFEMVYPEGWIGEKKQPASTDYTNNVNAGTDTASVSLTYAEGVTVSNTFTIAPKSMRDATITFTSHTYNGEEWRPTVTVDGEAIGENFTVTWGETSSKDAGTYTATITPTAANTNYTGSKDATYTIAPATIQVTPDDNQSFTYGETLTLTYSYLAINVAEGETPAFRGALGLDSTDAGTRIINLGTLELVDNGSFKASNYTLSLADYTAYRVTINKATPTVEHFDFEPNQTVTYNGLPQTATVTLKEGITGMGEIIVGCNEYVSEGGWEWRTDAGTYPVYVYVTEGQNYCSGVVELPIKFTIDRAATVKTAPVAKENLVYDGSQQALITAGEVSDAAKTAGFKMMYLLEEEDDEATEAIPVATNAGTYKISWYAGSDDNNFIKTSGTIEVTIAKIDAISTAPVAKENLVYTGTAQELTTQGTTNGGYTLTYKLDTDERYTDAIRTATDAGTYTVQWKVGNPADPNHNVNQGEIAVTIAKADSSISTTPAAIENLTYNGTAQELITAGVASGGELQYKLGENGTWSTDIPKATAAGDYEVYYKVEGNKNYNGVEEQKISVTIARKALTVTVADIANQTWTGSALTPAVVSPTGLVKETDEYCTVTYTDNTNVGLATVNVEEKGNYTFTAIEKTFLIVPDESLIAGLTTANVTSANKTDVDKAVAMMNNADLNDAPAEDKADWEALKTLANALQERIEAADTADQTQNIQDAENIGAGNVKLENKQDLEDALKDLEAAKENYSGNYTQEEKAALEADIKRIEDALAAIERVEDFNAAIDDSLLKEDVKTDMDAATEAAIKDAQAAYGELTDYEKTLIDPADKTKLDTLVATITAYKITKGNGGRYTAGSGKTLSFTANGPVRKFDYVQVNGKTIASSNYTVTEGSTIITLKSSYLDKLGYGKHKIQIFYTDGSTDVAKFRIYVNGGNPFTGDDTNMMLFTGIMMSSLLCLVMMAVFVAKKKSKYRR